ncbi:hypothetical protein Thimo_2524 [Thioflavicoccus mobilis 8321]|uniref:Uncharacterized protein n=1 Tax=Thioflavicoccus mobilis 8321 TaxID=765912 RepID=L0GWV9_9GAMM|nr:hypothetical protein [Thioflavicoccus mobilis]AGA91248.1 hypothetical protein Thimo_2524 [Thioflavicoccus mobilis 8321]
MSTTTALILMAVLAVLALGLFLLAARNWSKATALYTPPAEEPSRESGTKQATQAPMASQSPAHDEPLVAEIATPEQGATGEMQEKI